MIEDKFGIKRAVRVKERCFLAHSAMFAIIDSVMGETPVRFPSNGMLIMIFAVGQLKCDGQTVLAHPDQEILFV